ncbi:hypothetical protein [Paenibacillus sacheonensis]|uniref:Uncharacterized protein n=1 Tax=Paenibacillus sacheonensis TaxID=742054 RepID=A0A7X5BZP6_9BACL|nr:hypothetical protein [Paenibacillus sacheonensis]MBM7567138.1 hypothetical protein [Paenibacillus sacheonensis]NBC70937.1 hypothetical protein [Paenibacillus sacheonensis]
MQRFSEVLRSLRKWFETFSWYSAVRQFDLHLLFGGLSVLMLKELLYQILPFSSYHGLNVVFFTIPLSSLAYLAFLAGVWLTLSSANVKYTPFGLWGYAFVYLYPFTNMSLSSLLTPIVYVLLGFALFRYTMSAYAKR